MTSRGVGAKALRIGIVGIGTESSTFSPHRTVLEDFVVYRGPEAYVRYPWLAGSAWPEAGVDWEPLVVARALPGGPVEYEAYASLSAEIVAGVESMGAVDGLYVDLHGAMYVDGVPDPEADLLDRLRAVVGPEVLISASLDLHGNVSERLARQADLITCYRTAPHIDEEETRRRAMDHLVRRLRHGGRPSKAWIPIPVLMPGERTSTRSAPASDLYARITAIAESDDVLDAALWVGYAWADDARSHAAVVVSGDDEQVIARHAEEIALAYWSARADFAFAAPAADLESCLDAALDSGLRPYVISDSGDNPTAGGAGDVTYALARLVARPQIAAGEETTIYASIVDAAAVARMRTAGVGRRVTLRLGGHIDETSPPIEVEGTVHAVRLDDPVGGDVAVLATGALRVIVTSRRKPFHRVGDFTALDLDPRSAGLVVVKIGYLEPELHDLAAGWMIALTPGGVDQDVARLPYRHLTRPSYPADATMAAPSLTARLV